MAISLTRLFALWPVNRGVAAGVFTQSVQIHLVSPVSTHAQWLLRRTWVRSVWIRKLSGQLFRSLASLLHINRYSWSLSSTEAVLVLAWSFLSFIHLIFIVNQSSMVLSLTFYSVSLWGNGLSVTNYRNSNDILSVCGQQSYLTNMLMVAHNTSSACSSDDITDILIPNKTSQSRVSYWSRIARGCW